MKLINILSESIHESKERKAKEKPSKGLSKEKKSDVVKAAKAGKDIGKKGKGFEALAKKAGGGEKGKKIAAAAMWKNIQREGAEGGDHEVSMAVKSLESIMNSVSTLMSKLRGDERNIPGWIQDHISKAENYIDQAAQGFHELGGGEEEHSDISIMENYSLFEYDDSKINMDQFLLASYANDAIKDGDVNDLDSLHDYMKQLSRGLHSSKEFMQGVIEVMEYLKNPKTVELVKQYKNQYLK